MPLLSVSLKRKYHKMVRNLRSNSRLSVVLAIFVVIFAGWGVKSLLSSGASPPSLPTGVTLQQIDGGPNYYCSNGFTYACSSSFNGESWDDPRFFPILDSYSFYPANSPATFKDLGLNTSIAVTSDTDLSQLRNNGIWAILNPGEGTNVGAETVGWHIEEPSTWSQITSTASSAGSGLTGRFLEPSFTWDELVYGGISGTPCGTATMDETMSCTSGMPSNVHLNIPSADIYWFACSTIAFCGYTGSQVYGQPSNLTPDQLARGSNYGDMVDSMRTWDTTYPAPVAPYIETEDGLAGSGSREITPPELNWAVWDTITHGARQILYFGTTSNFGSGPTFGFSQSTLSGQSISMYNQAKDTNTLVKNLAPVINSPFALHYATNNVGGYTFPTAHIQLDNGLDTMTKYYTGGTYTNSAGTFNNGFYIFANVRGSETQTNVHATFTTADGYSGPVTVINGGTGAPTSYTVTATNGVFSDTFAKATDMHVYQIPYSQSTTPTVSLNASPTTITSGSSSNLTWSSTNATSCGATTPSGWTSSTATSGSQSVSPTTTTTYTISCTGSGGSAQASATVTVNSSGSPPTASVTSPTAGATVCNSINGGTGATVPISVHTTASAVNPNTVANVKLVIDSGSSPYATDTSSPYNFSLDTTTLSNGNHTLTAKVTDTPAGNTASSTAITVNVHNEAGDLNGDCTVNAFDLSTLLSHWQNTSSPAEDLNHDGIVNVFDLSVLLSHYGL